MMKNELKTLSEYLKVVSNQSNMDNVVRRTLIFSLIIQLLTPLGYKHVLKCTVIYSNLCYDIGNNYIL